MTSVSSVVEEKGCIVYHGFQEHKTDFTEYITLQVQQLTIAARTMDFYYLAVCLEFTLKYLLTLHCQPVAKQFKQNKMNIS